MIRPRLHTGRGRCHDSYRTTQNLLNQHMNSDHEKTQSIVSLGEIDLKSFLSNGEPNYEDLPILPTRNLILFPDITIPLALGRENSYITARTANEQKTAIGILCQSDPKIDDPTIPEQFYEYGVIADVIKVLELPDGTRTAILHSRNKFKVLGPGKGETMPQAKLSAHVKPINDRIPKSSDIEFQSVTEMIKGVATSILENTPGAPDDIKFNIGSVEDPEMLINMVATHMPIPIEQKIKLLAKNKLKDRGLMLLAELSVLQQLSDLNKSILERTHTSLTNQQKSAFIQQQIDSLRKELYGNQDETEKILDRARHVPFPDEAYHVFVKEVEKLDRLNPQSPDYSVQYTYIETLMALPWLKYDVENIDFGKAREILNNDHYGLEKVKDRILEQLAVIMNNPEGHAPILCLVGAPGVGKTSLGQSIARAMGRHYQRVSLGGLHDEAEIRGHRRTYIGAMPGRIMEAIKRAGTSNPVLLLDEIDKIGSDFKGDPAAALLEVLDPEQNCHFHDNYIDIDYDLSKVLFIATANTLSTLSQPLLDRMEVIDISGYLLEEKVEIAIRHLIPKILKDNKLDENDLKFTQASIAYIVEHYTSESGVRQLDKQLQSVVRKVILKKMSDEKYAHVIEPENVGEYLGVTRYNRDRYEGNDFAGVVTGLAWTAVGGEILYIETSLSQGKGEKLNLTGNLGNVMKESAMIALQYVKAHAGQLGIDPELFDKYNIHIHVPEGAIPKDGPSAGITMVTSIVSAFRQTRVKERVAMTGEITLRGKVLPVGGIKEKILAAKRAGITDIIISKDNTKDIEDIAEKYRDGLIFHYVDTIPEVVDIAVTDIPANDAITL